MALGDPKECRERADYCVKRVAAATSPLAREKFAHMAKVWLHLAIQLGAVGAVGSVGRSPHMQSAKKLVFNDQDANGRI